MNSETTTPTTSTAPSCYVCHYSPQPVTKPDPIAVDVDVDVELHEPQRPPPPLSRRLSSPLLKRCQHCRSVYYCSVACQTIDWKRHKKMCQKTIGQEKTKKDSPAVTCTGSTGSNNTNVVIDAYQELLQFIDNKSIQQLQQEYAQVSDYIKSSDRNSTSTSSCDEISDIGITTKCTTNKTAEMMKLLPTTTAESATNSNIIGCSTITSLDDATDAVRTTADTTTNTATNENDNITTRLLQQRQQQSPWVPIVSSSSTSISNSSTVSPLPLSSCWTFHMEYMVSLQCIQIVVRPPSPLSLRHPQPAGTVTTSGENEKEALYPMQQFPAFELCLSKVRVSFQWAKHNSDINLNEMMMTMMFEYNLDYERMEYNIYHNNSSQTNLSTRFQVRLPKWANTMHGENDDIDGPTRQPSPPVQCTTLLVEDNTAIAIRLTMPSNSSTTLLDSSRNMDDSSRILSELQQLPDNNDCNDQQQLNLIETLISRNVRLQQQQSTASRQNSVNDQPHLLQPQNYNVEYCLGCQYCHTPFASLPSASKERSSNNTDTSDESGGDCNDVEIIPPISTILSLPTGHLNELHDYLICYDDRPMSINFNTDDMYNQSSSNSNVPPEGLMYENDIIYIVSEKNIHTTNLCTLLIPSYGIGTTSNSKHPINSMIPSDMIRNSQVWHSDALPTATSTSQKNTDSVYTPLPVTATCALCASIVGYKVVVVDGNLSAEVVRSSHRDDVVDSMVPTFDSSPSTVGYHLLKHRMIVLQRKVIPPSSLSSSIKQSTSTTAVTDNDTAIQSTTQLATATSILPTTSVSSSLFMPTISQFITFEMIRIAEAKAIFTFLICKYDTDIQNQNKLHRSYKSNTRNIFDRTNSRRDGFNTVAIQLRLLNWNTIAATSYTALDSFVSTKLSTGVSKNSSTATDGDMKNTVMIPKWQRRAKVYYETILVNGTGIDQQQEELIQEYNTGSAATKPITSSFRKQFMKQHTAWCCPPTTSSTVNGFKPLFFMNRVNADVNGAIPNMDETSKKIGTPSRNMTTYATEQEAEDNGGVGEVFDPTIIRLHLSEYEFDSLIMELQSSSVLYTRDVVDAVQSSMMTATRTISSLAANQEDKYKGRCTAVVGLASIPLLQK